MARIEQRGTSWRVTWRLGGKREGSPQSLTFTAPPRGGNGHYKLAEAAKQLAESRGHAITRAEVERAILGEGPASAAGVPTLTSWAEDWLAERAAARDIQPDVLNRYRQSLNRRILPQLGHLRLTEIGQQQVRDWIAWMNTQMSRPRGSAPAKPLTAQTVRREHVVLNQVLGAAVGRYIPVNPAARQPGAPRNVLGLPKAVRFEGMFLEPWELDAILANCKPEMADIATVLVRTGLRLGEILVLRREHVILTGKHPRIEVRWALKNDRSIGRPKSEASWRDVGMTADDDDIVFEILRRRSEGKPRGGLLFPAPMGDVWCENNLRQRFWLPAVAAAQRCAEHPPPLPKKPATGQRRKWRNSEVSDCHCPGVLKRTPRIHDLRHTQASILIESGWMPTPVQHRLGHSSITVTMDVYGHLWKHGEQERLKAMNSTFRKGGNPS